MGMKGRVTILVQNQKDKKLREITSICTDISINETVSASSGMLKMRILDVPWLPFRFGDEVCLSIDDDVFFQGKLFRIDRSSSDDHIRQYEFCDFSRYLKGDANYTMVQPEKFSDIFKKLCSDLDIPTGRVDDTGWMCQPQNFNSTSTNEVFEKFRDETLVNTGRLFVWRHKAGNLELIDVEAWRVADLTSNILPNIISLTASESINDNTFTDVEFVQKDKGAAAQKKSVRKPGAGGGKPPKKPDPIMSLPKQKYKKAIEEEKALIAEANRREKSKLYSDGSDEAEYWRWSKRTAMQNIAAIESTRSKGGKGAGGGGSKKKKVDESNVGRHVSVLSNELKEVGRLKKVIETDAIVPESTIDNYLNVVRNPTRNMRFTILCDKWLFVPGMRCFIGEVGYESIYLIKSVTTNISHEAITQDIECFQWQSPFVKSNVDAEAIAKNREGLFHAIYNDYTETVRLMIGSQLGSFYEKSFTDIWKPDSIVADDWGLGIEEFNKDQESRMKYTSELAKGQKLIKGMK